MTNGTTAPVHTLDTGTKRAIIQQMINEWHRKQYLLEVAIRVDRKIGNAPEIEQEHVKELHLCVMALDELATIAAELTTEHEP